MVFVERLKGPHWATLTEWYAPNEELIRRLLPRGPPSYLQQLFSDSDHRVHGRDALLAWGLSMLARRLAYCRYRRWMGEEVATTTRISTWVLSEPTHADATFADWFVGEPVGTSYRLAIHAIKLEGVLRRERDVLFTGVYRHNRFQLKHKRKVSGSLRHRAREFIDDLLSARGNAIDSLIVQAGHAYAHSEGLPMITASD